MKGIGRNLSMTRSEKIVCGVYAAIAVSALVTTWSNNIAFMLRPENQNTLSFIRALYVNGATASIANDLLLYALAGCIFMVREARRLHIRHVWVYILLSLLIAVSVMFPLFLIARQIKMSQQRMPQSAKEG
jgi:Terpene cyclase DEP1